MKSKKLARRIIQYVCGLICMAIGLVLLKQMAFDLKDITGITLWGVSPITAVPDAVATITPLSLGNATIILHALCVIGQIIVQKRVTLKSILCMCVGIPFGKLVDFFMWVWSLKDPPAPIYLAIVILIIGIAIQGFGVALISGCDMMLPAPDEMNNVISRKYNKNLGNVKMVADAVYVIIAVVINIVSQIGLIAATISAHGNILSAMYLSVGISSVASVLLTGRFVGLTFKFFPGIKMSPFFNAPKENAQQ